MAWALCTFNFSEGRRPEVIQALVATLDTRVLSVAANPLDHRCVVIAAATTDEIVPLAVRAAKVATRLIDLTQHQGTHPRMGALDVLSLAPVAGLDLAACQSLAAAAGAAMAAEAEIPVFLYGEGASRTLAQIRGRGFEELRDAMVASDRLPDFGPARVHPTAGALAVGARLPPLETDLILAPHVNPPDAALRLAPLPGVRGARPHPAPEPAVRVTLGGWTSAPLRTVVQASEAKEVRPVGIWPLAPLLDAGIPVSCTPEQVLERAILEY